MDKQQSKQTFNPLEPYPHKADTPCYGKGWNPTDPICITCPALNACGTRQMEATKILLSKLEGDTPFLSKASRYNLEDEHLLKYLRACSTKKQALSAIKFHTNLRDADTLEYLYQHYTLTYELKISE